MDKSLVDINENIKSALSENKSIVALESTLISHGLPYPQNIKVAQESINAVEEFSNHIVRNGYQTITISTRQGKPVHFKNEVSIKLNNIPEEPDN